MPSNFAEEFPGSWYLKKTEEDGVVVKTKGERMKNRAQHLMEKILDLKPAKVEKGKEYAGKIEITFKNSMAKGGVTAMVFRINMFDSSQNSLCGMFSGCLSGADFAEKYRKVIFSRLDHSVEESTDIAQENNDDLEISDDEERATESDSKTPSCRPKKAPGQKKTKRKLELKDFHSPPKQKATTEKEEIFSHRLGFFNIPLSSIMDCKQEWLDRPLYDKYVGKLVNAGRNDVTAFSNMQPWVVVANISKSEFTSKEMIKGCNFQIIGGRHRMHAFKELVSSSDEVLKQVYSKIWANVYDNTLTNEQVRILAAQHNYDNVGSRPTAWIDRVRTCREWLYTMSGKDSKTDEVPEGTTEWKKSCQRMYVAPVKDVNTLEPTLQAATLKKATWEVFERVSHMYTNSALKGMDPKKRNRSTKEREIKQHQVGMPLQGISEESKLELLHQVERREIDLKEMAKAAKNIKAKKNVTKAFLEYVGEETVDALQKRFPFHATEEQLSQFKDVKIKRGALPLEMENFFKRAISWEKEAPAVRIAAEKEGVYYYESTNGQQVAFLSDGFLKSFKEEKVKEILHSCVGFQLILVTLDEECSPNDLKLFLIKLHAINLEKLQTYCVVVFPASQSQVTWAVEVLEEKMTSTQQAYWVDTKKKHTESHLLQNSVHPFLIGHWGSSRDLLKEACHFESAGNAFLAESISGGIEMVPETLLEQLITQLSFTSNWILDLTHSDGRSVVPSLSNSRNCLVLMEKSRLRHSAAHLNKFFTSSQEESAATGLLDDDDETFDDLQSYE